MKTRFVLVALAATVGLSACGKKDAPKKAEPAPAAQPAAPAPAPTAAPVEPAKPAEAAKPEGEKPAEAPAPADEAPGIDKDKLSKTYQEVYCAQKKGEMDKILGIYKSHGFATPQDFTKAWIEAAKDTDWVTRMAQEVGKKCQ